MPQINLHTTADFDRALAKLMKARGIRTKSEAIRLAVAEAASRGWGAATADFTSWIGLGMRAPLNRRPRFTSDDDLWR